MSEDKSKCDNPKMLTNDDWGLSRLENLKLSHEEFQLRNTKFQKFPDFFRYLNGIGSEIKQEILNDTVELPELASVLHPSETMIIKLKINLSLLEEKILFLNNVLKKLEETLENTTLSWQSSAGEHETKVTAYIINDMWDELTKKYRELMPKEDF